MEAKSHVRVRVQHSFPSTPERVFDAWLDPAIARRFLFATPTGEVVRCEIDPRVGGTFRIVDRRKGQDVEHVGAFLEIERPRRLAFEYAVEGGDKSRVELDLVPSAAGCEAAVTHELHPDWADFAERSEEAWTKMLQELELALKE